MNSTRIQELIPELYNLVARLEEAAPGRSFAPDGHLLGSIGEVIAAAQYDLQLTTASTKGIDAHTSSGQPVEIKCTGGGGSIALRGRIQSQQNCTCWSSPSRKTDRQPRSTTDQRPLSGMQQGHSSGMVSAGSA